jgi:hypothetical protein
MGRGTHQPSSEELCGHVIPEKWSKTRKSRINGVVRWRLVKKFKKLLPKLLP